ncbi:ribbon-helix-helix domain-containing protein [Morganella morganii]
MNTIRWNVAVSADTDQSLRMFLASQGGGRKGDLSRFIEEAVRAHILELSAEQAKAANAHLSEAGDGRENGQNRTLSMRPVRLRP